MTPFIIAFHDRSVAIEAPPAIAGDIARFFALCEAEGDTQRQPTISIRDDGNGRFALTQPGQPPAGGLSRGEVIHRIAAAVGRDTFADGPGVLLQAAAVGWGEKSILILGSDKMGKSSLAVWLVENGFAYLSDDDALLTAGGTIAGFPEPPSFDPDALAHVAALATFHAAPSVRADKRVLIQPAPDWRAADLVARCGLIIEAHYAADTPLQLDGLSPAETALRLLECTRKVVIPGDPDHAPIVALAEKTPAVRLTYSTYAQLEGVLDFLARAALEMEVAPDEFARFVKGLSRPQPVQAVAQTYPIQTRTERKLKPKLTIGMPTYDDFDGVYFSVQAIRMYHAEVLDQIELVVIDNHPEGRAGEPLKKLDEALDNYRYVPYPQAVGSAAAKNRVFEEAQGEYVLCMDCHVLIVPGALQRLLAYFDANPDAGDLLQGPLFHESMKTFRIGFEHTWREGYLGTWADTPPDLTMDSPPFDIAMHGLGLFACRRDKWLGFNPHFRGFGGEEGYLHDKFRRAGRRTLCLPFLRWLHRFVRPAGPPYPLNWSDVIRNYVLGMTELDLPTTDGEEHFRTALGRELADKMFETARAEIRTAVK